jgi:hypothetical protein
MGYVPNVVIIVVIVISIIVVVVVDEIITTSAAPSASVRGRDMGNYCMQSRSCRAAGISPQTVHDQCEKCHGDPVNSSGTPFGDQGRADAAASFQSQVRCSHSSELVLLFMAWLH